MSRTLSVPGCSSLPRYVLFLAVAVGLALTSPANAGIGNPIKKAKEKLQKATEQKAEPSSAPDAAAQQPVVFDDVVVELTGARLDAIVTAFRKSKEAGAGRPALVEKLNRAADDRAKHLDKHGRAMEQLRNKRGDVEACYQEGYQTAQDRRLEEYKTRALTDPALLQKFQQAAMEHNAAAARGDSAAIQKLQAVMHAEVLPTREDSTKVRQSCGPIPPRSAAEDREDAIEKEIAGLEEQIRTIDERVAEAQSKEGGLDRHQWGVALERIEMYLSWMKSSAASKSAPRGFSPGELEALEKRLETLRAALG